MANIVLTNKCNLKCSYCFAKEITKQSIQYFTIENFIKALNYIKTGNTERVGIIGGEPLLHPYFYKFVEIMNKDNEISKFIIFTNGIELNKYIDILTPSKFGLLINCNSPKDMGNLYNKLENSIKLLEKSGKNEFVLGINIYSPFMDYSYIFDLLKITNQHKLRFSISISNIEKQNSSNILDVLKQFNHTILNFYNECIKNEIVPCFDCGGIPICIMNDDLIKAQIKIKEIQKKININQNIFGNPCSFQVDILPDLTAIRSICYPIHKKIPIFDFKSIQLLINYFNNDIDVYNKLLFASERCKDCKYRLLDLCHVCPSFMINQFKELKNYVLSKPIGF